MRLPSISWHSSDYNQSLGSWRLDVLLMLVVELQPVMPKRTICSCRDCKFKKKFCEVKECNEIIFTCKKKTIFTNIQLQWSHFNQIDRCHVGYHARIVAWKITKLSFTVARPLKRVGPRYSPPESRSSHWDQKDCQRHPAAGFQKENW